MKILIIQPKLEHTIKQLENELHNNNSADIVIFPEGYLNENIESACHLAKRFNTILIGGHRRLNDRPKDRAIIIDRSGTVILDRIKYSPTSFVEVEGLKIGHILCDELIVQGIKNESEMNVDLVVHPIGVGMFSEEQFQEWIDEARKIAITYNTMIIGTSHADGSYGDTGVSIPIAYCFGKNGEEIFISKNDVRPRILDLQSTNISISQEVH
ncbi:hypothetical protein [Paenibacillus nasutitermitis]|uniref:CN hydrolase domain-containing protein n=1 Tax=Paenibacillus nasutitermitis TaxID=1652958 RepID=A0A917DMD2_9BACL|nr:hypothetical protein [Paenibacillus nasutitermitis]GGD52370.1 hypothetical protein GCM10010911_07360 [Paenibacillus nasutitermitis]